MWNNFSRQIPMCLDPGSCARMEQTKLRQAARKRREIVGFLPQENQSNWRYSTKWQLACHERDELNAIISRRRKATTFLFDKLPRLLRRRVCPFVMMALLACSTSRMIGAGDTSPKPRKEW